MAEEKLTIEQFQNWISEKAAGATAAAKPMWEKVLAEGEALYNQGKPLVLKDGKLDLTGLKEKAGEAVDYLKNSGAEIIAEYGPKASEGIGSSIATIVGTLVFGGAASVLDMGLTGTLLLAAFGAVVGAFVDGEKGILGGFISKLKGNHTNETSKEAGKGLGKGGEGPEVGPEDAKPAPQAGAAAEKPAEAQKPAAQAAPQDVFLAMKGDKISDIPNADLFMQGRIDDGKFVITKVAAGSARKASDGSDIPPPSKDVVAALPLKDGIPDFKSDEAKRVLDDLRAKALGSAFRRGEFGFMEAGGGVGSIPSQQRPNEIVVD